MRKCARTAESDCVSADRWPIEREELPLSRLPPLQPPPLQPPPLQPPPLQPTPLEPPPPRVDRRTPFGLVDKLLGTWTGLTS
ncbi:hypothetical protein Tco_0574589 [Tanacetum coccineum]